MVQNCCRLSVNAVEDSHGLVQGVFGTNSILAAFDKDVATALRLKQSLKSQDPRVS